MSRTIYTIEDVEHMAKLIIPKLETIGSGNGANVHRAYQLIELIEGYLRMAKAQGQTYHIVVCHEYIRTAEMWLTSLAAREGKENG